MGLTQDPPSTNKKHFTIIVEHLDPELESWQALEYQTIASECSASNSTFLLSGLASASATQAQLNLPSSNLTESSVETRYTTPEQKRRVCLLDPKAEKDLSPEDGEEFDVFLFGGILGDDPPRDRTADLRAHGFGGRRLGPDQMTTDTAARVTRIVVQDGKRLDEIPFVDRPDIVIGDDDDGGGGSESVSMPFKYVRGEDGKPIMPEGMLELLGKDADKGILDLL
ncbi:MAG: hypothetical protein INR62_11825 [Rhodospirillales bacterium]|nr:hypothetical protein [Acetobacter sp.]